MNEVPDSPNALRDEPLSSDIERRRQELLMLETIQYQALVPRHLGTLWAAMIPRVVPSVATYGAFEKPL